MNLLLSLSQTDLLQNISEGFVKSLFQIFISIIIIILFIGVFILIGIISTGRVKDFLNKLSIILKNPDNKNLLLTDSNIFHNALNKLRT